MTETMRRRAMGWACAGFWLAAHVAISAAGGDANAPLPADVTAAAAITDGALRAHIRFLADDLLEGRAPGSRGDLLAQRYIAAQLEGLGLRPALPGGQWLQRVPLVGVDTRLPPSITFRGANGDLPLKAREEFILVSGAPRERSSVRDAEVVFVGYGMVASQYDWNDFEGADVRGKVLLIMNNDPASDPKLFAGDTRLYYGRWDYKYEEAARQGAAAAFIIHTTPSAGYPWQVVESSWTGEQFELHGGDAPRLDVRGWLTEDAARRLAKLGGRDLDDLRRSAEERTFRPVPLGVRWGVEVESKVRNVESANVLALLEGADPARRDEMVVCTAHHDHLGVEEAAATGADRVYNGAVDNASGVATLLAIARAFTALPAEARPARSILFAAVAAEEQGLLGSELLARSPPVPAGKLAAVLNVDGINIWGRTRDVTFVGRGKSSLDRVVDEVAGWQGRVVKPDQFPDRGYFYRSDQFSFARIGVPGIYLDCGTDFVGRPAGWGKERIEEWEKLHYHQPSDELRDDWDLAGAVDDARLLFHCALRVARVPELPAWVPGDEFEAARQAALRASQ